MAKIINITRGDRTFEVHAMVDPTCDFSIEYSVYEVVRPHWKFFRTTYLKHGWFFVSDFDTILDGLNKGLDDYLKQEAYENSCRKKIEDFEKNA